MLTAAKALPEPLSATAPDPVQPLEACLLLLLAHHGRAMSLAALRANVSRPEADWRESDFVEAVESLGFHTRSGQSASPPVPARNEPVLLLGPGKQAALLLGSSGDGRHDVLLPGSERPVQMSAAELQAHYAGRWIQVRAPSRLSRPVGSAAQGRRGHWFWGPVLIARPLYARAALAATLTNVFALATSIFSMIVYDRIIPNNAVASLYALLVGVSIVFASDFIIRSLRAYFIDVAGSRADLEIADAVFDQVLDLDMRARRAPAGTLASILKEFETIRDFFTSATLTTLIDIPFALLFIVVLYWIGGPMAWVPVVAWPLMIGVGLLLQPTMQRQSQVSQEDSQVKQGVLVETLGGLESIKALGAGAVMRRRWQDAVAHQARLGLQSRLLATLAANWSNLVFMVSQVAVVTVGVFLAVDGKIGAGAVVAGSILCGRAIQPLAQLAQLLGRLNQSLASFAALSKIMALPREHAAGVERLAHDRLRGSIELRDVSFSYPGQTMPILQNVSLRIEPGERVAIIGRVGSGKTTLVKMLLGLYPPDSGAVLVGGSDVRQIDPSDLRRNIGAVLQDVWLMSGSLRQNIALGADRPSDAQVLAAAELAGVHEFAVLHPLGYQLRLGEGGEGLSGGQRQCVGLARALIGDPPMLLFDEPTSAMDPTAERLLLQRLKGAVKGKTLVLVTHKPSMLELVDKVIVLERGRVIAHGPKDSVMRAAAGPVAAVNAAAPTPGRGVVKPVDRLADWLAPRGRSGESIAEASRIGQISRASNILLLAIAGSFAALVAWAAIAEIDTLAQASGKVVPSARVQQMQSLEGGLITAVHVKAGDAVEAGTLLVTLSPTQAGGDYQTRQQQALSLGARIARLRAEADGTKPVFAPTLQKAGAEYVKVEQAAFDGRQAEQVAQMAVLSAQIAQRTQELEEARIAMVTAQRTLAAANEERDMLEKLVAQGLEPRIELVRIARIISDAEGRDKGAQAAITRLRDAIVETRARRDSAQQNFKALARDELNRALGELRAIEQGLPALEDRFDRTALKAPVRGVVNRVFVNTVGGVAKPGDALVELVPADDPLVVEAMVNPRDIGFVKLGQDARVKLTAYDYSIYGAMPGKVVQVGADAVTNERGEAFFLVRVETEKKVVDSLGSALPIISGMQAQVDIVTGSKTVLRYLLKPLIAVQENAFRER